MKSIKILIFVGVMAFGSIMNANFDVRTYGADKPGNKQDENGNTFMHEMASQCDTLSYDELVAEFSKKLGGHDSEINLFIQNKKGQTAKDIAKANFKETGSLTCALLIRGMKITADRAIPYYHSKSPNQ